MHVQRFAGHLANLFDPYIEDLKSDIRRIMSEAPETLKNQRKINRLINDIKKAQLITYGNYNSQVLFEQFREFAINESSWELSSLSNVLDDISLVAPSTNQIWAAVTTKPLVFENANNVKLLEPFIKDWEAKEVKRVSDLVRIGYATGQTTDQITRNIAAKNGPVDKVVKRNIKSMVRTSTNHVSNIARLQSLAENSDIVKGYRLITTFDSRTTDICRAYGEANRLYLWTDDYLPLPPFHVSCRTGVLPVLIDDKGLDGLTKSSKGDEGGAPIDANETQYSWLKKQSAAFQDDAIGPTRAKLLRDGGLTSKEFGELSVDKLFRPIDLKTMQEKAPLAFKRAGLS